MHQLRAPWMAFWLALALVVAPALGRMHEVLHAPGLALSQAQTQVPSIATAPTGAPVNHVHGQDWFGEHSALECLVFDQLGHGGNFHPAIAVMAQALPDVAPIWSTDSAALPAASAAFEARAPPHVTA